AAKAGALQGVRLAWRVGDFVMMNGEFKGPSIEHSPLRVYLEGSIKGSWDFKARPSQLPRLTSTRLIQTSLKVPRPKPRFVESFPFWNRRRSVNASCRS